MPFRYLSIKTRMFTVILTVFLIKDGVAYKDCDGNDQFPDYYWRQYTGEIPKDAVGGGIEKSGEPTYIGQIFYEKKGFIPGIITPGETTVRTTHDGKPLTIDIDRNTRILCTGTPHRLKWISTNARDFHQLTNYHIVIGGMERNNIALYLGRTKIEDGSLRLGKVYGSHHDGKGLNVAVNEKKAATRPSYEILVYDYKGFDC